jgi:hypothetical protein
LLSRPDQLHFFVKELGEDHGQLRSGKINDYLGNLD